MGVDIGFQADKKEFCFGDVGCRGNVNGQLEKRTLIQLTVGRDGWSLCFH